MIRIITHSGKFHADEVFAIMVLRKIFRNIKIIRTRDKHIIENPKEDDILVDIGKKYDRTKNFYDHHQSDFNEYWKKTSTIKLASAGLIWKTFGIRFLSKVVNPLQTYFQGKLCDKIYYGFVQEIDAVDNGIKYSENPTYRVNVTISSIISAYNNYNDVDDDEKQMSQFIKAMNIMEELFRITINKYICSENRYNSDKEWIFKNFRDMNDGIVVLNKETPVWHRCIREYERINKTKDIKFIVYQKKSKDYRLHVVNEDWSNPRIKILSMKELIDNGLKEDQIDFVHNDQFIAGFKSLEDVLSAAVLSIKINGKIKNNI